MYSSTTLIGHLGQDPETRTFDNGRSVTRINVATTRRWKDAEGNRQENTEWHNCDIWGKLGEVAQRYLRKGDKVHVVGDMRSRKKDDVKYWSLNVSEMTMLGSPRAASDANPPLLVVEAGKQPTAANEPMAEASDDLPF